MVGIFSKFSATKTGHRRTQSALETREVLPPNSEATGKADVASTALAYGIENAVEFKPLEHPTEPLDNDRPVQCPLPEPSILNDGRIWKERVSAANVQRRSDVASMKPQQSTTTESESTDPEPKPRWIAPSWSAPEHNLVNLLQHSSSSGL